MRPVLFMALVTATLCAALVQSGKSTKATGEDKTSNQKVRIELESAYATQDEAIKKNDFKAFVETLAPDYSLKLLNGEGFSREQVETFIKNDMTHTKTVAKSVSTIDSLTVNPGEAVVVVTHEASRILTDGQNVPHKWENKVVHKETWARTTDGWKLRRVEELKQLYLLRDGSPLSK
jgi:hypothetical protein